MDQINAIPLVQYIPILLFLVILSLFFYFVKRGIKRIFNSEFARLRSDNYPIVWALLLVHSGFVSITGTMDEIVDVIRSLINAYTSLNIEKSPYSGLYDMGCYIIFCLAVFSMIIVEYRRLKITQQRSNELEGNKEQETTTEMNQSHLIDLPRYKPSAPPNVPQDSPIFHERIRKLFELKYKKLRLEYDREYRILYGSFSQGFHNYNFIIYCDEGVSKRTISKREQRKVYRKLSDVEIKTQNTNNNSITEIYYILENGDFENDECGLICMTEDEFLNQLIDFHPYLERLVNSFENDTLPFSTEKKRFTLSQTFVAPNYNDGQQNLESYIDNWLDEDSKRHLAILGDYGMGKTSFMKYYAHKLAKNILEGKIVKRFPVFISLTNTSPMHGGIKIRCESFVAKNLGVDYSLFEQLAFKGKLVFILDGFDEMGFIGTHDHRLKQLNAIWQLATANNKIMISGRPSYFPNEFDLRRGLNILSEEERKVPQEIPYSEAINLDRFNWDQIEKSIKSYYGDIGSYRTYSNYVKGNRSIYELCERPSMLHMVREMLPYLIKKDHPEHIGAGTLMRYYIDHWIERQLLKQIVSVVEDKEAKKRFLVQFFTYLAGTYYEFGKGNLQLPAPQISNDLRWQFGGRLRKLGINNEEDLEGFENEILTAYFLERSDDEYKFVHKSFYEYFVSLKIIWHLQDKEFSNEIFKKDWTNEIMDFVYNEIMDLVYNSEQVNTEKSGHANIPLLLNIALPNNLAYSISFGIKALSYIFKYSLLLSLGGLFLLFFWVPKSSFEDFVTEFIGKLTFWAAFIGGFIVIMRGEVFSTFVEFRKKTRDVNSLKDFINYFLLPLNKKTITTLTRILKMTLAIFVASLFLDAISSAFKAFLASIPELKPVILDQISLWVSELYSITSMIRGIILFGIPSILWFLFGILAGVILLSLLQIKLTAKAYYINLINKALNISKNMDLILFLRGFYNRHTELSNFKILNLFRLYSFADCTLKAGQLQCFKINFVQCNLDHVIFHNFCHRLSFQSCTLKHVNISKLKFIIKPLFRIKLLKIDPADLDKSTFDGLKYFVQKNDLKIGKHLKCDDWLIEKLENSTLK